MTLPHPRSTLFPYTRSSDLIYRKGVFDLDTMSDLPKDFRARVAERATIDVPEPERVTASGTSMRSEEHTSELQSRQYLVCRLLLEKKKKIQHLHLRVRNVRN